jgi:hypothetical protein
VPHHVASCCCCTLQAVVALAESHNRPAGSGCTVVLHQYCMLKERKAGSRQ